MGTRSDRTVRFRTRGIAAAVLVAALGGCAAVPEAPGRDSLASVEPAANGLSRVTLTEDAAERIGIQTVGVRAGARGVVVPYSAVIYDTAGEPFAYTNPDPLVFQRSPVRVATIRGDRAILERGPAPGTPVVTVGASQLLGIELGIGIS